MSKTQNVESGWAAANTRNTKRLGIWTAGWVLTMAVANFGPHFVWQGNKVLTAMAIGVNLLIGVGMILANKRFLQGQDEMHQRIQLEAMALTLGVGLIAGLAYSNLDTTNLIPFDAEISHLVILMSLTYMAGLFRGLRRFR
ncbi:MAG: hypothetical protein HKN57_05660 [Xanthomonadales bacterium]|nr:hypothetical protein [Gammaproteobacteria bacterium]MBT8053037.1 hypothetical protein [Gammaproteobacteria bacterium]NND56719.1 hypothetical protein [Xanthomonadales bacterium]NNK52704.1 hypothetical protein [Xanthomonadales bacterium]